MIPRDEEYAEVCALGILTLVSLLAILGFVVAKFS